MLLSVVDIILSSSSFLNSVPSFYHFQGTRPALSGILIWCLPWNTLLHAHHSSYAESKPHSFISSQLYVAPVFASESYEFCRPTRSPLPEDGPGTKQHVTFHAITFRIAYFHLRILPCNRQDIPISGEGIRGGSANIPLACQHGRHSTASIHD